MALKTSIYLNDDLQRQLDEYLAQHPDESLSSVLQQALEAKLVRVQVNAAAELLKIAGIARNAPPTDDSNREELFMRRIVLDAGPLYALFSLKDTYHSQSKKGFQQLAENKTALITPVSIVFEVYKLVAQRDSLRVARTVLKQMLLMDVKLLSAADFEAITTIILSLLDWSGSLEDASVVWLTRAFKCPVWTLNYRDFGRFQDLEFWNPRL